MQHNLKPEIKPDHLLENQDINHLQLFVYLIPVVGFFPALWTLYRRNGTRSQRSLSKLAVQLALGWMVGYFLLGAGAQASDNLALSFLLMSSLLTSGYFLVNLWFMVRLWQHKSIWLPGIGHLSDRLP